MPPPLLHESRQEDDLLHFRHEGRPFIYASFSMKGTAEINQGFMNREVACERIRARGSTAAATPQDVPGAHRGASPVRTQSLLASPLILAAVIWSKVTVTPKAAAVWLIQAKQPTRNTTGARGPKVGEERVNVCGAERPNAAP